MMDAQSGTGGWEITPAVNGINKLPQEITDRICDHIIEVDDSKNLRLVAKRFSTRATRNVSTLLSQHGTLDV